MIRARAAFAVSRYAKTGFKSSSGRNQIYAEDEISEDIELGSRVHAAGYKSVFVAERLATGEAHSPSRSCFSLLPAMLSPSIASVLSRATQHFFHFFTQLFSESSQMCRFP
jgi:hypothetical protein